MRSFKFANDIAFMGQKILVVVLVGIEAEIAIPRTAQVDKKCRCSLPLSTGQACRRNPAAPQGAFAIFTMARTRRGNFGATRSRTRFRNLERNAEGGDSMFVVAFDLVECPCVLADVHQIPLLANVANQQIEPHVVNMGNHRCGLRKRDIISARILFDYIIGKSIDPSQHVRCQEIF